MGATVIGRDLGPRVSSALTSGLTADCTSLEIGSHEDKRAGKTYENLLYQIRPAFGGNIVATIINPEHRPQMATVREGVMKKEILDADYKGEVVKPRRRQICSGNGWICKIANASDTYIIRFRNIFGDVVFYHFAFIAGIQNYFFHHTFATVAI